MRPDPAQNAPDPGFIPGVQPDTLPMSRSPYGNWRAGAPPPPPTGGLRRPPSYPPPPSSRRGLVLGLISAVFLVALVAGGLYLADPALFVTAKTGSVTATATLVPATATLVPTATLTPSPTLTATPAPTATDTPAPTATLPTGFQSYGGGDWAIGYPAGATYTAGNATVQGISIPDVRFNLGQRAQLTVYDSPLAAPTSAASQILTAALAADGATNITTIDAIAPATIGAVTWQRTKVSALLNGQPSIFVALYVTHGTGAIAIAYSAPATTFATIEAQTCLPMVQTFMFAQ